MEQALHSLGYLAVLLGAAVEGESVLLLACLGAPGLGLELPGVALAGGAGAWLGDQTCFLLGRYRSAALLRWRPSWRSRIEAARGRLEGRGWPLLLGFRFLIGLRMVTPLAVGLTGYPHRRFATLNAVGATLWALLYTLFGASVGVVAGGLLG